MIQSKQTLCAYKAVNLRGRPGMSSNPLLYKEGRGVVEKGTERP